MASLLVWLFFTTSLSPLYPTYSFDACGIDSTFFMWTGKMIVEGKTPYIDFYDHKGPLIFYLNALGYLMGGESGMIILLFITHFLTFFFFLLSFYRLGKGNRTILVACGGLFFLYAFTEGGNQTGEYFAVLSALIFYFACRYYKERKKLFIILAGCFAGFSAACAFFSRPSEAVFPFAFCVAYLIYFFFRIKEENLSLLWLTLSAILTFALFLGIFSGIAMGLGYFNEFVEATFSNNVSYASKLSSPLTILCRIAVTLYLVYSVFFFVRALIKKEKEELALSVFFFAIALIDGIPNLFYAKYPQYWISSFPFLVLQAYYYFSLFPIVKKDEHKGKATAIASSSFTLAALIIGFGFLTVYYTGGNHSFSSEQNYLVRQEIEENIPDEVQEQTDGVFYLDCNASVLLWEDNNSTCRHQTYQTWHATFYKEIDVEITDYLKEKKPTYVVKGKNGDIQKDDFHFDRYLFENYEAVDPVSADSDQIQIYKLK